MFKIWDATVLSLATTSTDICLVAFSLRKKKERRKKKKINTAQHLGPSLSVGPIKSNGQ